MPPLEVIEYSAVAIAPKLRISLGVEVPPRRSSRSDPMGIYSEGSGTDATHKLACGLLGAGLFLEEAPWR